MSRDSLHLLLTMLLGTGVIVALVLIALVVTYPGIVRQSAIGAEFFLANLGTTSSRIQDLTGFRPIADILLFLGSYVLVSLIMWGQAAIRKYLRIRPHF